MRELEDYLNAQNARSTAKRYYREIEFFIAALESQNIHPKTANYSQVMDYIGKLRGKQNNLSCSLYGIKKYYRFLVSTGVRKDNPAQSIRLRDKRSRDIQLQDLFKPEELEILLVRQERYPILKNRNKIVISLLIYQGVTNADIKALELNDIDLEKGTIYLKQGRRTNSRTLKLKSKQVFWIMRYLQEDRPKLLAGKTSDVLLIGSGGSPQTGEGISYVVETQKHLFPNRKLNAKTIRQSVITNLLKQGKDLRIVQAFAGHKYPSTTERYKQRAVEVLKHQILKHHPLQ